MTRGSLQAPADGMGNESMEALVGQVVADKYRLEALVGSGGMGAVYLARHLDADFAVALKVIRPGLGRPILRSRFLREARVTSKLRHPHVVTVVDFGRWPERDDALYLAMEFVEGVSLGSLLDTPELPIGGRLALIDQALDALAHVHARGVVHRDIKPDNILVGRTDGGELIVKLTDFGIAASLDESAQNLTQDGEALGTPSYMAPEVASGHGHVVQSDLYAIGTLLYRVLAGRLPFEGSGLGVMVAKASSAAPVLKLRSEAAAVGEAVVACVMALLDRDPSARPPMAADVRHVLKPLLEAAVLSEAVWAAKGGRSSATGPEHSAVFAADTQVAGAPVQPRKQPSAWRVDRLQLIGRENQLEQLGVLVDSVQTERVGRVAVLMGEPGLGKSEMASKVLADLEELGRFRTLHAQFRHGDAGSGGLRGALEQILGTVGRSFAGVREVVRSFLQHHGDDDEREVEELSNYLRPSTVSPAGAPAAGGGQQGRNFALVVRVLRRLAQDRPVALGLDDLVAGGPAAAAFVEHLLFEADYEPFPVFVLATTRPLGADPSVASMLARSDRFEGRSRFTLTLTPLPIEVLADGLVEHEGLTPVTARRVAERATGHPLFAQHLARSGGGGTTTVPARAAVGDTPAENSDHVLPAPLQALIDASVGRQLSATEDPGRLRELLLQVAVLGDPVDVDLLEAFVEAGGGDTDRFDDDLDALLDVGLLVDASVGDNDVVSFAQRLGRDALMAGLNSRRLRRYHKRAADVSIQRSLDPHVGSAMAGSIGDHLAAAGSSEEAADWWLRALEYEMGRGETLRGARWGLRAVASLPNTDPRWAATSRRLGRQLLDAGDFSAAESVLRPVVDGPDADAAGLAGDVLSDLYENTGATQEWKTLIAALSARFDEMNDRAKRAVHRAKAIYLNTMGKHAAALEEANASLVGAVCTEELTRGNQRLALVAMTTGEGVCGLGAAELAVAFAGDDEGLLIRAMRARGVLRSWCGRPDGMEDHQAVHDLGRRTGRLARVPVALADMSQAALVLGRFQDALVYAEKAERAGQAMGLRTTELFVSYIRISALLELERLDEAEQALEASLQMARRLGSPMLLMGESGFRAWLMAKRGDGTGALDELKAYGRPESLPNFPAVALLLEGVLRAVDLSQLKPHHRPLLEGMLRRCVEIWAASGNTERRDLASQILSAA